MKYNSTSHVKGLPLVSIVIATKNEAKNIKRCLSSITIQTYPKEKIEIIVVDNNSTDKTKQIARQFTTKVFNKGPERSTQRNFGIIQKSTGKYILYLDADMTIDKTVIEECVIKMQNDQKLVGLFIPEIVKGVSFWSKVRSFERSFYNNTLVDGLRFFRKNDFVGVRGFDETMYACEDWDLDRRIKKRGTVSSINAPLYHFDEENLKKFVQNKRYYAKNVGVYINKWGKSDLTVQKQLGWFYRLFTVFIEKGKWKKILFHPVLFVGIVFLKGILAYNLMLKNK